MKPLFTLLAFALLTLGACRAPVPFRVLAYNIRHGEGLDGKLDLERIAGLIREWDPDVVTLQEVDVGVRRTDGVDQARTLGELTGMHHAFGRFMGYQGGQYGMAVLSRFEILESKRHVLPPGTEPRSALAVRVRVGREGPEVTVVGIHLYRTETERLAQANALIEALDESTGENAAVILAGDFNSEPGTPVMQRLSQRFHIVEKDGPSDTFPADGPDREIDYFLVRPRSRFVTKSARVMDETVASDHRPIVLDVEIR